MVEWKGEVTEENSGEKASRLDSFDSNNVPNFFVLTREEVQAYVGNSSDPEMIENNELPDRIQEQIEEAYNEIGISSEVREASGKAKSLVGGQRNNQKVSVRISDSEKGIYDYLLNVGKNDLNNAVKKVLASYYEHNDSGYPGVIVQKMVEPEYTGAVISSYLGDYGIVEAVEGLGISLETGITRPELYLLENNEVRQVSTPEEQVKVTLHPLNNDHRTKKVVRDDSAFDQEELETFYREVEAENVNVKFVYKRGSFYIVDVFETDDFSPFMDIETSLKGMRVSKGKIEGVVGEEVTLSNETLPPEKYDQLISFKGGYTSTDAQKARKEGKPAVFSAVENIEEGDYVEIGDTEVEVNRGKEDDEALKANQSSELGNLTAIEVLPIDKGEVTIDLSPPYSKGYSIADRKVPGKNVSSKSYISSYKDVFTIDRDKIVVDGRKMDKEGLPPALEYLKAEKLILLLENPSRQIVRKAVEEGVDVIGVETRNLNTLEKMVAEEEKKFILDSLREAGE